MIENQQVQSLKKKIEPLWAAYEERRKSYEAAELEYHDLRNKAMSAVDPRSVIEFATNESVFRERVKAAMNDWVLNGFKNEVESMLDRIVQLKAHAGGETTGLKI
jgi:hypothetical protein